MQPYFLKVGLIPYVLNTFIKCPPTEVYSNMCSSEIKPEINARLQFVKLAD